MCSSDLHQEAVPEKVLPAVGNESPDAVHKAMERVAARDVSRRLDQESLVFLRAKAARLQTTLRERSASPSRKQPVFTRKEKEQTQREGATTAGMVQKDSRLQIRDSPGASGLERGPHSNESEGTRLEFRDSHGASGLERGLEEKTDYKGLGSVLSLPGGQESQDIGIRLIDSAEQYVRLLGFTFDRADVTEALKRAKSRNVDVAVGVDKKWTLNGRTREQLVRLKELEAHGVVTRVVSGRVISEEYRAVGRGAYEGIGILHAKAVHTDAGSLIGSANWTTSSRSNVELGVEMLLHDLAAAELKDRMTVIIEGGDTVMDAEVLAAQRSHSESGVRRRAWT